jgi:hypothetical protein
MNGQEWVEITLRQACPNSVVISILLFVVGSKQQLLYP